MSADPQSAARAIGEERRYALSHLAHHLYAADLHPQLERLISKIWLDLQVTEGDGKTGFLRDVSVAIQSAALRPDLSLTNQVVQVWRSAYICACVRSATGWPPSLVQLLVEAGRFGEAKAFATLTSDPYARCISFCRIAECASRTLDAGAIVDAAEKALAAAEEISSVVTRSKGLAQVVALALALRVERVLAAALDLLSHGEMGHWMEDILCDLSQAAVQARRPELLDPLLELAWRFTQDDANLTNAQTAVLSSIVEALGQLNRPEPIKEILRFARARADSAPGPRLLGQLMLAFAAVDDESSLHEILQSIETNATAENKVELLARGAEACNVIGDQARVETLVAKFVKLEPRPFGLNRWGSDWGADLIRCGDFRGDRDAVSLIDGSAGAGDRGNRGGILAPPSGQALRDRPVQRDPLARTLPGGRRDRTPALVRGAPCAGHRSAR